MRNIKISSGEYYHIFNRGVNKQIVFHDKSDYLRFLFLILYFQSDLTFNPLGRFVKAFTRTSFLDEAVDVANKRNVELIAFCILSNHFHLIVKEVDDNGIARYMQRILNSYTKYYNTKYEKSGHLFQGPYQAVHISDNRQLLYLSTYIHKNPANWSLYQWSSYRDFVGKNKWGALLMPEIITEQFKGGSEYKTFIKTSLAKEFKEELDPWNSKC